MRTHTATFVTEVTVTDPETKELVKVSIYKHDHSGFMFALDKLFIEANFCDDETPTVADPYNNEAIVELFTFEGTEGQDRKLYSDDQDRENYQ